MTNTPSPPPQKPSRFTSSSLTLAVGLAACYLVLTWLVPALDRIAPAPPDRETAERQWTDLFFAASRGVSAHRAAYITWAAVAAVAGFGLPLVCRPARYLVSLAALVVCLFALVAFVATYVATLLGNVQQTLRGTI